MSLNKEERDILEAYDNDEFISVKDKDTTLETYQQIADETFKKDKRITIRLTSRDLESLRKRAIVEGIPYQTLVSSIIHKYVNGLLSESQQVASIKDASVS